MTADTENTPIFTELLAEHGDETGTLPDAGLTSSAGKSAGNESGKAQEDTERKA
ncbi:hypothetical protein [Amycolatopsis palatopharyngis]|uniref:hypothetical protein n=1 Tax=Amycolatopsis palatopharyngis TaxID=187982 RepID=UPI0013BE936F|nr:hypothetical protein [Amycolatopsis palatopharyngis]